MSREAFRRAVLGLARVLLLAHALLLLALGYWGVVRAPWLLQRGDNARWQAFERGIARGRILDRQGRVLAETVTDASDLPLRRYPHPSAAHVVGYQAWRYGSGQSSSYGSAGAEGAYDAALRGDLGLGLRGLAAARVLHRPQLGHDLRLTIDAELQDLAAAELAGREGVVVLLDVDDGAVLTMASLPAFDPATLDSAPPDPADPRSPLLNRATQGLYPPGSVFKVVTLAGALEEGLAGLDERVDDGDRSERLEGVEVACGNNPPGVVSFSLEQAFGWSCNLTFARLGAALGTERWARHALAFGIADAPPFPLPAVAGSLGPDDAPSGAELVEAHRRRPRQLAARAEPRGRRAAAPGDGLGRGRRLGPAGPRCGRLAVGREDRDGPVGRCQRAACLVRRIRPGGATAGGGGGAGGRRRRRVERRGAGGRPNARCGAAGAGSGARWAMTRVQFTVGCSVDLPARDRHRLP